MALTTDAAEGQRFLDLAFAMDCTGSMHSYINSATQSIRQIVECIVSEEKADVRLALVEYRDHPPQDTTFVTNVHDFTSSVNQMRQWLEQCHAAGGGDTPEAVADALFQVFKLDWKPDAAKVCVLISDAPPHGLGCSSDCFPNGCPEGIDTMEVARKLAEKGVSLYVVGCEPSITPYKEFFMGLAHVTGGQYVPLRSAKLLAKVITGGVQEELSLQQLMEAVNREVNEEFMQNTTEVAEEELVARVKGKLRSKGVKAKQLQMNNAELPEPTTLAKKVSTYSSMAEVRQNIVKESPQRFIQMKKKDKKLTKSAKGFPPEYSIMERATAPVCASLDDSCDSYECCEDEISEAQVQRLVQKSVVSNKLEHRYKKKY